MKKKNIILYVCSVLVLMLLCGCTKIEIGVEMNEDGTAKANILYAMDSEYCTEDDFSDSGYEVKHYTFNDKDYIGFEASSDYNTYDEMCTDLVSKGEDDENLFNSVNATVKKGLIKNTYVFEAEMPALLGEGLNTDELGITEDMIEVSFNLKMPGKISGFSNGTLNDDGTVNFKVESDAVCNFYATSSTINYVNIAIIAVAVFVVIILIVTLTKKKKA